MAKYLLLKHYRGGPEPHRPFPPMDQRALHDDGVHVTALCLEDDLAVGVEQGEGHR